MIPNGLEPITEEEYNAITSVEGKTVKYSAKRTKSSVLGSQVSNIFMSIYLDLSIYR